MLKKILATFVVVAIGVSPAFAATEYFIAHKPNDKACTVVQVKPDGKTMVMVGKTSFKSTAEATTALKAAPECKA